jgi:hypothetical protein
MRNMVYELLFKRDGLVLLHNAEAFFAKKPNQQDYSEGSEFSYGCEDCQTGYPRDLKL